MMIGQLTTTIVRRWQGVWYFDANECRVTINALAMVTARTVLMMSGMKALVMIALRCTNNHGDDGAGDDASDGHDNSD